ncbi:hypothetical protein FAZ69_11815 [Trinickia terrae]|uniref:Uncharacterized protein n=1 Tax=Trinickia terrae TaxID=2571161 RepID=A0A4U1I8N0_9BURK|nr:hypothetical protein FAZ69_11815 [Trinickia terrae]
MRGDPGWRCRSRRRSCCRRRKARCISADTIGILSIRFNETVDVTRRGLPGGFFFGFTASSGFVAATEEP